MLQHYRSSRGVLTFRGTPMSCSEVCYPATYRYQATKALSIVIDIIQLQLTTRNKANNFHRMTVIVDELRRQTKDQLRIIKDAGMKVADIAAKLEVKTATVYQL